MKDNDMTIKTGVADTASANNSTIALEKVE